MIAVLGVAGLGLAFDRFVIGSDVTGPSQSSAGIIEFEPDPASLLIEPSAVSQTPVAPKVSLADRLRQTTSTKQSETDASRDAFVVPAEWLASESDLSLQSSESARRALDAFKRDSRLDAVLVTGSHSYAVVNGQTIYLGQRYKGLQLVAVHERSADFEVNGFRVSLSIHSDAAPSEPL